MRLDFNVLWVEDQQQNVLAQKERLELLVRTEGFRLRVQFAPSVAGAKKFLFEDVYGDHVDLILMDYNLGPGPHGDVGITEIRKQMPYKELIFYSAQGGDLRKILAGTQALGVHLSNREELPDTAKGVFDTLVKKVIDIEHSRGIVMGITSDIDEHINDSLVSIFEKLGPKEKSAALELVQVRLGEIQARQAEVAANIKAITHLAQLFEHHAVYSANDRLNLLRKLLEANSLYEDKTVKESLKAYCTSTVQKRNVFAHVRVRVDGFSRRLLDKNGKEYTSEEMKKFRLELLGHAELFESLARKLAEKAAKAG